MPLAHAHDQEHELRRNTFRYLAPHDPANFSIL